MFLKALGKLKHFAHAKHLLLLPSMSLIRCVYIIVPKIFLGKDTTLVKSKFDCANP